MVEAKVPNASLKAVVPRFYNNTGGVLTYNAQFKTTLDLLLLTEQTELCCICLSKNHNLLAHLRRLIQILTFSVTFIFALVFQKV